jgi:soluble lytic murein transglycosylase-like protein
MKRFLMIFSAVLCGISVLSVAQASTEEPVKQRSMHVCGSTNAEGIERKATPHLESINTYANKYGVNAAMVKAVIAVESCYNSTAVSPKGAQGLMQLIPATAARFGVSDAFNTSQNIHGGTRYLSWLMKRYNGDLYKSLAAYNAGEGAVDKYKGIPPYNETQHYVRRVLTVYNRLSGEAVPLPAGGVAGANGGYSSKAAGRVSSVYLSPFGTGKPGRAGLNTNRARAPHLYKR